MPASPPQRRSGFKVAVICALPIEAENVISVFDEFWDEEKTYGQVQGDPNAYTTGRVGEHNVVLAHMPSMGGTSASAVAASLRASYTGIQLALVVGICGVVPTHAETREDIVLGDVVISTAVIQYDFGKQYPDAFHKTNEIENMLSRASLDIRSLNAKLRVRQNRKKMSDQLAVYLQDLQKDNLNTRYPGTGKDQLYPSSYIHQHRGAEILCDNCEPGQLICSGSCAEAGCEEHKLISRHRLHHLGQQATSEVMPSVHFGRFASANTVMKSGMHRDRLAKADKVIAFEMEGAGVWDQLPTVVIKGACDYADSHKNQEWQNYAAATAAAGLKAFLEKWIRPEQISNQGPSDPIYLVPFDYKAGFVGRSDELGRLQRMISQPGNGRIAALLGLGGIGKSRLALELASQMKMERSVFWVQATDQLTFERDILAIGKALGIPGIEDAEADVKHLVKQRLGNPSLGKWLLMLDNADDEMTWGKASKTKESKLIDYLPRTSHGFILVTTRSPDVANFLAEEETIELYKVSMNQACEIFEKKLLKPQPFSDQNMTSTLVDKLACLPLAIVQAAAFIRENRIPIQEYLDLMDKSEEHFIELLSEDFGDTTRYQNARNPIATTWLISFEYIYDHHQLAAAYLSSMACLHEKNIPQSLLPAVGSDIDHSKAIGVLKGYSFLEEQTSTSPAAGRLYDMHRLVHLATRNWLKRKHFLENYVKEGIIRVANTFPKGNHKYKSIWTIYLPHGERLCTGTYAEDLPQRYDLLQRMGRCMFKEGKYHSAVEIYSDVVRWREQQLGDSDMNTLRAYNRLGQALDEAGKPSEAKTWLEKAVHGRSSVLGKTHPSTLASSNDLALVLESQGKYTEAEQMHQEVLQARETVLGKDHLDTLASVNNLALTITSRGRYAEAERMHREVLQVEDKVLGKEHPDTLISMHNLALVLQRQGKYAEAEQMHHEVLQSRSTVLGKEHPDTLISMNNLASILREQGKFLEAEQMHREVIQLEEKVLGKIHPDTLTSMHNLSCTFKAQGRDEEARKLMARTAELREKVLGPTHPHTLKSAQAWAKWSSDAEGLEEQTARLKGGFLD